jgi:hypothetical protein
MVHSGRMAIIHACVCLSRLLCSRCERDAAAAAGRERYGEVMLHGSVARMRFRSPYPPRLEHNPRVSTLTCRHIIIDDALQARWRRAELAVIGNRMAPTTALSLPLLSTAPRISHRSGTTMKHRYPPLTTTPIPNQPQPEKPS